MPNSMRGGFLRDQATGALVVNSVSPPMLGGLMPPIMSSILPTTLSAAVALNRLYLTRAIPAPKTGVLSAIGAWVGAAGANLMVGVYDTGDALAGSLTKLYDSGSFACPASGNWRQLVTPNLAVTAGKHLVFGIIADAALPTFGRVVFGNSPAPINLPAGFLDAPGGISKLMGFVDPGSFTLPATITEAAVTTPGTNPQPYLLGNVT